MCDENDLQNLKLISLDTDQDKENLKVNNENECSALIDQQKDAGTDVKENKTEQKTTTNNAGNLAATPSIQVNNCEETEFYKKAQNYWAQTPATVNGMLGGLGYINSLDIQGSVNFLRELRIPEKKYALDCGAGIGRVSKNLLMPRFECVDLVEQDTNFAKTAESYCTIDVSSTIGSTKRLGQIYNVGLQAFTPTEHKYDLIWSQWVLGHLTDEDLLAFFWRVRGGLKKNGYFVIKENVTSSKTTEKDDTDSSVTRPLRNYENLLRNSGFKIVKITKQQNFPKGLYPVFMLACRAQK